MTIIDAIIECNKNSLQSIKVNINTYVNESDLNVLFKSFEKIVKLKCFSMESMISYGLNTSVELIPFIGNINKNLNKLDLIIYRTHHLIENIIKIIDDFKSLKSLSLTITSFEMNDYFILMSKHFNHLKNLLHLKLYISRHLINDQFFESIDEYLPKLQSIECNYTTITEQTFQSMSKLKNLQTIRLNINSDNRLLLRNNSYYSLIKQFIGSYPNLKSIIFRYNSNQLIDLNADILLKLRKGYPIYLF